MRSIARWLRSGLENKAGRIPEDDLYSLEMTFSRGLFSGWLHGVNHQRLVNGRCGKKRGAFIGFIQKIGKDFVEVDSEVEVKPGDGVVFDAGADTEQEQGGRIYEVRLRRLHFRNGQIDFQRVEWAIDCGKPMTRPSTGSCDKLSLVSLNPFERRLTWKYQERKGAPLRLRVISDDHAVEAIFRTGSQPGENFGVERRRFARAAKPPGRDAVRAAKSQDQDRG